MSIRELNASLITDTIERMCIEANEHLPDDVKRALTRFYDEEDGAVARTVLKSVPCLKRLPPRRFLIRGR